MTQSAKSGDHLVRDINHIMAPTYSKAGGMIALRGYDHSTRGQDRFRDKDAHFFCAHLQNLSFQFINQMTAESLGIHPLGSSVGIRRRDKMHSIKLGIQPVFIARLTRYRGGKIGATMVGIVTGNNVLFLRPTEHIVVEHNKAQRRIHCSGATRSKENMIEIARCYRRQALSQTCRWLGRMTPWAGIR